MLLELAKQLKNWINNSDNEFYYESMDYEEAPILLFRHISLNNWLISGNWMNKTYSNIKLSDFMVAFNKFIEN